MDIFVWVIIGFGVLCTLGAAIFAGTFAADCIKKRRGRLIINPKPIASTVAPYWICPDCGAQLLSDPLEYLAHGVPMQFGYSIWNWRLSDGKTLFGPMEHHCRVCRRQILVEEVLDEPCST